jgi:hypothetical protein
MKHLHQKGMVTMEFSLGSEQQALIARRMTARYPA